MRRAGLLLALAALLAGCAVDQTKEVATYRSVVDAPLDEAVAEHPADAPLPLLRALVLANQHNERLGLEGENYLQAVIDRRRAVANFLPTLNLVPTWTLRDRAGTSSADGGGSSGSGRSSLNASLQADANLFNGFSDVADLRGAEARIQQRRALLLDAQEELLIDVARAYYAILKAQRSAEVLRNSLAVQEARVRDIRGRQVAGLARPLDVAQTQAQASATRVSLISATSDVANERSALRFLTNAEVAGSPLTDEFAVPEQVPPVAELKQLADQNRPDLVAAERSVSAARQGVSAAVGQWYPSLSLQFDYFLVRDNGSGDRGWLNVLRANLPIFAAGRIHADVREAWSIYRQALFNQSLVQRSAERDVETAAQNLATSRDRISELRVQVTAANEAFRQADQSYNVGLATNLERLTAQDQLLTAELQLAQEEYDAKVLYLELLRATGRLRYTINPEGGSPRRHEGHEGPEGHEGEDKVRG